MINRAQIKDIFIIPSWILPISYFIIIVMLVISLGIFFVVSCEWLEAETILVYKDKQQEYIYYGKVFLDTPPKIKTDDTVIVKFPTTNKKYFLASVTKIHFDSTTGKRQMILEFHNNDIYTIGPMDTERIEKIDILYMTNNFLNHFMSMCIR